MDKNSYVKRISKSILLTSCVLLAQLSFAQRGSEPIVRVQPDKVVLNEDFVKTQPQRVPIPEGMVMPETPAPEPMPKAEDIIPAEYESHPEYGQSLKGFPGSIELIHKRDRYSKEYQTAAHSYSKLQSYSAMHYKDGFGRWLTLDTTISVNSDEKLISIEKTDLPLVWDWENDITRSDFEPGKTLVFKNTTLHFANEAHEYLSSLQPSNSNLEISSESNLAEIHDYWSGIDKSVTINNWGFKHEYILKERPALAASSEFMVLVDAVEIPSGWNLVNTGNPDYSGALPEGAMIGDIIVENEGGAFKGLIHVPSIYEKVTDKENSDKTVHFTAYEIEQVSPTEFKLTLVVPTSFLNDENTTYPVVIDPSASQSYLSVIGTNYPNASSACQSSTMFVNVGTPAKNVYNTFTDFRMVARNGAWLSEQRGDVIGPSATAFWVGPAIYNEGTTYYSGDVNIANGVQTGNIPFIWRGWRTWGYQYTYTYSCGWNGWSTCTGTATEYCGTRWQYMQPNWYVRVDYCDIPQGGTMTPSATSVCEGTSVNISNSGWSAGTVHYWASTQGGYPCAWDIYSGAFAGSSSFNYTYPANGNTSGCESNPWRVEVYCASYNSCYGWNWGTGHTIYIDVYDAPYGGAGSNITSCGTTPISMSGATAGGQYGSVSWSFSGTGSGTFTNGGTNPGAWTFTPTSASGSGTATLTVNGNQGCTGNNPTYTRTITWVAAPTANAGSNISTCVSGSPIAMTGASAGGTFGTAVWSGGGGSGSWSQNTSSPGSATFTPSTASGSFTATLTVNGSGVCTGSTATDTRTITWSTVSGSAGGPLASCGSGSIAMPGATATGSYSGVNWTFIPSGGSSGTITTPTSLTGATFNPTSGTGTGTLRLTITGSGACTGTNPTYDRTVTWSSGPIANAGSNLSVCGNGAITMTGASGGGSTGNPSWSGGAGSGTWSGSGTDPSTYVFTPSVASGSFTATLTVVGTGACTGTTTTDTRTITWVEAPGVSAGSDINSCTGTNAITMTGASASGTFSTGTWSGGGGLGSWSQNTGSPQNATFTPSSSSGSFVATLTVQGSGSCSSTTLTDTRVISWGEALSASAGSNLTSCGTGAITMTGSTAGGTFGSIAWTGGTGSGSWTTTHPTDPSLWVFTPSTASGSFTATLTVTGTGGCTGSTATDTRTVTWEALPTANAGTDILNSCTGTTTINLTGATAGGTYNAVNWSIYQGTGATINNGGLNPAAWSVTPTDPASYMILELTVTGSGTCLGNTATDFRIVEWGTDPVINTVTATDVTDCSNDNGVIVVDATGYGPLTYSNDGGTTTQAAPSFDFLNDAVNYNIVVSDTNGCTTVYGSNPVVLGGPTTPTLSITVADAQCNGAEDGEIQLTVTAGGTPWYAIEAVSSSKTYQDTTTAVGQTATINVIAETYNIEVSDRFGCTTTAGPYVINEPTPLAVSTTVVNNTNCLGTDGSITISVSGGTPSYTYSFNGSGFTSNNFYNNLGTGDYPITVRDNNGCETPFLESIGGPFEAEAGIDRYVCAGSSLQMNAQLNVNAQTVAGGAGSDYDLQSITYVPRTPTTWTNVSLLDDAVSGAIGIPFTFTFYGANYNNLYISSNGFVTFNAGSPNGCCAGQALPNGGAPNNLIALCWEDLDPPEGSGVIRYGTWGTAPNRIFVIEYNAVEHYPSGAPVTGQIQLYESTNNVEIHNTSVTTDGANAHTQGVENATGTLATTSRNATGSWSESNTAYLFQPPYDLTTINYSWSPSTGLSNPNILNPTVSGLSADQTYTLQVEVVGICTITDDVTVHLSDLISESSGTYGTAPNVSTVSDVICNGDDDGCITVTPTAGEGPYLLEGPAGEIQVYDGRMKEITVSNATGGALTDYQVEMTVSHESAMRADFGDIRFYDGTSGNLGDILPYWVESFSLSSTATVYVKVPSIPAGGTTLYMTYGNSSLTTQSDPDNTLWWYEDMMGTPSGTLVNNASYIDHQYVRLTQAVNSASGQLRVVNDISAGGNGFVADFQFWAGGGNGADGLWMYSDGNNPGNGYVGEDVNNDGYAFVFDTWNPGGNSNSGQFQLKKNGANYSTFNYNLFDNSTWHDALVEQYNTTGRMSLNGTLYINYNSLPADNTGSYVGFGARTGGANNEHRVRNIKIRKRVDPAPAATFSAEILPDNQFCDLAPGNYTISVWDIAECSVTEVNIPITEPTPLSIDNIDVTDTWCYVTNNGELDITVSGGTPISPPPAYLYTWAGPSSYSSNTEDPTGLSPGVYNVTVADDNACTASSSATVGTAVPITAPNFTWTGNTDQLWQDATNWDCGVPDATSEVIIPAVPIGGNLPIIQNGITGDVLNIDIQGNTSDLLDIQDGGLLRIWEP